MKHVKTFEGFLDIFRSKKSDTEKRLIPILSRLRKVQKLKENPYQISKYVGNDIPDWIRYYQDGTLTLYEVVFDDVSIVVLRDVVTHRPSTPVSAKTYLSLSDTIRYDLFFRETDSDQHDVYPSSNLSYSFKEDFWRVLDTIWKNQKEYKQSDRLQSMVNPAADLL